MLKLIKADPAIIALICISRHNLHLTFCILSFKIIVPLNGIGKSGVIFLTEILHPGAVSPGSGAVIMLLDWSGLHWYNASMRKKRTIVTFLLGLVTLMASACSQGQFTETLTSNGTLAGTLRPYPSDTPSATPLPTGYKSPTPSPTITPTATQVYYEVQLGDDMYSIGWLFDVSPEAIMTANPDVDPRAMSVETTLLIPITPMPEVSATATQALESSATPDLSDLGEPDCYSDSMGGLWCFLLFENTQNSAQENVSAIITLSNDDQTQQEVAILPLNLLPAGTSLPLVAYFQAPIPEDFTISARLDFSLPVMADDQRYLDAEIGEQNVAYSVDELMAVVSGVIHFPEDGPDAAYVWVSAAAFDVDGHIVAVRRWDSTAAVPTGLDLPFEMTLYSLGGTISWVDLVVEARAVEED